MFMPVCLFWRLNAEKNRFSSECTRLYEHKLYKRRLPRETEKRPKHEEESSSSNIISVRAFVPEDPDIYSR